MSTGSLTDDKALEFLALWGAWVDGRHPNLEFCRAAGLEVKKAIGVKGQDLDEEVDLGSLALAEDQEDEGAASSSGTLRVGLPARCPSRN